MLINFFDVGLSNHYKIVKKFQCAIVTICKNFVLKNRLWDNWENSYSLKWAIKNYITSFSACLTILQSRKILIFSKSRQLGNESFIESHIFLHIIENSTFHALWNIQIAYLWEPRTFPSSISNFPSSISNFHK